MALLPLSEPWGSTPPSCTIGPFEALVAHFPFLHHFSHKIIFHISLSDPVMFMEAETGYSSIARNGVYLIHSAWHTVRTQKLSTSMDSFHPINHSSRLKLFLV